MHRGDRRGRRDDGIVFVAPLRCALCGWEERGREPGFGNWPLEFGSCLEPGIWGLDLAQAGKPVPPGSSVVGGASRPASRTGWKACATEKRFARYWKACGTDQSIGCLLRLHALLGPSRAGTARLQLRIDLRAVCSCRRGVLPRVPHGLESPCHCARWLDPGLARG